MRVHWASESSCSAPVPYFLVYLLEVGMLAAVVDRAISMSYIFVVGGGCTLSLRRKSSADFKEQQKKLHRPVVLGDNRSLVWL